MTSAAGAPSTCPKGIAVGAAFNTSPDGERVLLLRSESPEARVSPNHATFIFDFANRLAH
jgi:hypothetical protein